MESTTTTREAKLLRRNPSDHHDSGGGGGNDLISHLSDDILAHILASLPSMTDVMRACAVSRRWRHLGARVPVLRFFCLDHDFSEQEKLDRFIAFVNSILARRADDGTSTTVVEELEISFKLFNSRCMSGGSKRVVPSVSRRVDSHVSKSFTLQLNYMLPLNLHNSNSSNGCMQVLGSNKLMITCGGGATRLESMVLSLNKACLRRLPTNVTLDSLVHLTLEDVDDLNQLLSTARCPSLRKLCLHKLTVSPATTTDQSLHLESNELLEVSLDWIWSRALVLELRTPRLRVFHTRNASIGRLVISAPRLEELTFFYTRVASIVQVEDMPCVRIFETEMSSLRRPECNDHVNQTRIRLLRCCKFLQFLTLHLTITQKDGHDSAEVDKRYTTTSSRYIFIIIEYCKRPTGIGTQNQRDHHIISLEHLQDIKITSAYRREYEARLLKFLHASAPALKKMIVAFISAFMLSQSLQICAKECEEFLHSIPLSKEGKWAFCYHGAHMQDFTTFEWTPIKKVECRQIVHMD
uniref:F-box domain-containing protein n=1 Tax=Oryza glumipatula TaxID=40148 RepID=A0A0D9Z7Z4_9ORYZ